MLTLVCGKFILFEKKLVYIGGIPRLVHVSQCSDVCSAVQIAAALVGALDVDVSELPLSPILSWYGQKAVCVLLALLHPGIKCIRPGPSPPAFPAPDVLSTLAKILDIQRSTHRALGLYR